MSDLVRNLTAARALIADPAHWTQGTFARGTSGDVVSPHSSRAVCWCAFGAIVKIFSLPAPDAEMALRAAARRLYPWPNSVTGINDGLGHKATLKMFDAAIEAAKAAP